MTPGARVGRFIVERYVARGGMGTIYRARDPRSDAVVALKVMPAGEPRSLERFAREARVLQELHHPGIVAYLDHGRTEAGDLYLAMEWLDGEDLAARLAGGELNLAESLRVAVQTAAALAVAHARQIVHRDVKPSNLFLVDWGVERVKVLDFGIARLGDAERLTGTGEVVGTPSFMAPEQVTGGAEIDARADVFALGALLFRCLTGRPVFKGTSASEVLAKLASQEAPRVRAVAPEIPAQFDDLLARMLARDPAQRPRDAGAVLAELLVLEDALVGPTRTMAPPAAMTQGESRVVCALLAGVGAGERVTIGWLPGGVGVSEETLRQVASAHDARVESLGPTRLVALFAEQVARDLARQAARCALVMRARVPGAELALVTGRAEITAGGSAGVLLQRAARLAGLAIPAGGAVRLDEATAGLLDSRFDVAGDDLGLFLRGEREGDDLPRTWLGKATPFVGRDRELTLLEGIFGECSAEGLARPVLVVAGAGMGKSRLRQELVARLRGRSEPVEIWIGRGEPMRAGAPFGVLGEALRRAAGIQGGEPLAERRALLVARVARRLPPARVTPIAELLGEIAGVPFDDDGRVQLRAARRDPALLGDLTRAAFEELLAAECAAQPVVLVLEDLHWGDLSSVRLVDAALRALAEQPLMVLGLARADIHGLFPRLWAERGLQEINLGSLPRRASERLVTGMLGDVDADTMAAIVQASGGNALFLEELMRQAVSGRASARPETVLAMIATRLEAMESDVRRVLRAASVFGEIFWAGGVRALVGGAFAEGQIDHALRLLVEREVVRRSDRCRFPGDQELRFGHSLLREAAYLMLTDADRVLAHRLAGAWLEAQGETEAVVVAEHHERGGEAVRAARWYLRAAEQALAGNDVDGAIARAERGVSGGAAGDDLGKLLLLQAVAHRFRGDNAAAERTGLAAMEHVAAGSAAWNLAAGEHAAAAGKLFHTAALRAMADRLAAAPADALGAEQAIALARTATQCFACAEPEAGQALLERATRVRAGLGRDPGVDGWIDGAIGWQAFMAGSSERAVRHFRRSADGHQQAGDVRNACAARMDLGYTLSELGAHEELVLSQRAAIEEADRIGLRAGAKMARGWLALSLVETGDLDEALAVATEAVGRYAEMTQPRIVAITRTALGVVLVARGDLERGETELRAAFAPKDIAYPASSQPAAVLARLRVVQGDPVEALELATYAAVRMDPARGICPHESVIRLALAESLRGLGRLDDAHAGIRVARERLLQRLAAIESAAYRAGFLARVEVHVRTLALAREWLGEVDGGE